MIQREDAGIRRLRGQVEGPTDGAALDTGKAVSLSHGALLGSGGVSEV
jgi:hypothetical protein